MDLKYWSLSSLSKLASVIGILIMADKNTIEKPMVNYDRVLIDVPIMDKGPKHIHFDDEKGIIQQQEILSKWEPMIYTDCKKYGHQTNLCKKKISVWELRPKPTHPAPKKPIQGNLVQYKLEVDNVWVTVSQSLDGPFTSTGTKL